MLIQTEVYAKPGELMQGVLPGDKPFLLSNKSSGIFKTTTTIQISRQRIPSLNYKANKAVSVFWNAISLQQKTIDIHQLAITQESNISVGKGLSSSSADVLGILQALNLWYNTSFSVEKLYELAASIEPTDPCLHSENLFFNQYSGETLEKTSPLPYHILYFDSDEDAVVDTVAFSKKLSHSDAAKNQYAILCNQMQKAFVTKDYTTFYSCLHSSAEMNNFILPKKNFNILQEFALDANLGIFVAHSGTYMGLVASHQQLAAIEIKAQELIKKHWNTPVYIE